MAEPSHYETLGVARNADRETIRRAYLAIARDTHPDQRSAQVPQRSDAELRIRAANAAWNTLGDQAKRQEYDRTLPDPVRTQAPQSTQPNLTDARPAPPSGIVVSAQTASLWKWGPVAAGVLIGLVLLIGSAYATSQDPSSTGTTMPTTAARYTPGSCVVILASDLGKIAQPVSCTQQFSNIVSSQVDSPRPCPPLTVAVPLADGRTTLCLASAP
jgi:hypothetical protein